jgi:uncharacterized protein YciI
MATPQWLFRVHPARPDMLTGGMTDAETGLVGEHFAYWKHLTETGVALVVGRTQTTDADTIGLAIFRAENEREAQKIGSNDPAVLGGVFLHQVDRYVVALLGDPGPFKP